MRELDQLEDALIERFRGHPVLAGVERLAESDFLALLLQRRFVSLAFTTAYDLAIDLLTDEPARRMARVILREEYPGPAGDVPSHREELVADLLALGVTREALVRSRPTEATTRTIADSLRLIADTAAGAHADAGLLTILRFWGEVLVSTEYGELWRRMAPLLAAGGGAGRSSFYHPHHVHDAKSRPLAAAPRRPSTHSDQLGERLSQLLDSPGACDCFARTEEAVLAIKERFYDQFTPRLTR